MAEQYIPKLPKPEFVRADLKPELFDNAVIQKGLSVIWEQSMFCSCYSDSGQPNPVCPTCHGKGYVHFGAKETKALVTAINGHKEQTHIGIWDVGSAYLTPLSTDDVGFRDRFTFVDFRTKFSEVIVRGAIGVADALTYKTTLPEVVAVRKLDTVYSPSTDFTIGADGKSITWMANTLLEGDSYSILYRTPPVYIAINPIHELRGTYTMHHGGGQERFVVLPKQFQIKREDFL